MSRRFGRNQRRRMREALAAEQARAEGLQGALAMDRGLLRETSRKLREAEDFQREIARIVGRTAVIAGSPEVLKLRIPREDALAMGVRVPEPAKFNFAAINDWSAESTITEIRCDILRILDVEVVADVMRHVRHAFVMLADGKSAYALSEMALWHLDQHELESRIAPEIARHLALFLKKRQSGVPA